ncbi:ABC transporter substrate-binding protein [Sinomonas cellulolyticus]|uniref:ABC transporter substrate-binding protein n=1 Tax=Sinomonas cellulolyticus TaxID=2801916 RepID=A0ABS1K670_9MICC|nr:MULTISPECIES: ABC transporter substrate-binding protein [Sinomonas]MBL0706953.1 ABC transporter substrate-binding protein [Sinomonas cellulolyticus]GHG59919.1 ABC transporter substrate-binding protein [Sinomonas sp. KCTC 49339]
MDSSVFSAAGKPLSRRTLLAGSGLALLSTVALSACGSGGPAVQASGSASSAAAKQGGTLRIARPPASKAETLDPASSLSAYEYLGALYSRLVRLDESNTAQPDLAESWQMSKDAMTWTFSLRKGVKWHDGKPFSAKDVAYTIQHILDPAVKSPQAGVLAPFIKGSSVTAKDDTTAVFTLTTPNAEFVSLLAGYNCYIIPEGSADTIGKSGIGTGPFKLDSFTAAGPGKIVRNEDYFGGKAKLDVIEFSSIADTQARVNALLAGQVDLISQTNLDYATSRTVIASAGATVATVKNAQWYTVPMLNTAAPFTDPLIRRALAHAYNPKDVMQLAVNGNGTLGHNNPVPPSDAYRLDYGLEYDLDKSKALLKQAGMSTLAVEIYTSTYDSVLTPLALALKGSVADAGITLDVKNVSSDSYYTDIWMKKPLMVSYWYAGRPIDQLLNQIFRSGSSYNESGYANPQFDKLLDDARATVDDAKRKTLYQDAQKLLIDDAASLTPFFADRLVGLSKKVAGYKEYGFEFDYLNIGLAA